MRFLVFACSAEAITVSSDDDDDDDVLPRASLICTSVVGRFGFWSAAAHSLLGMSQSYFMSHWLCLIIAHVSILKIAMHTSASFFSEF